MDDLEDYSSRPKPSKTPSWVMLGFIFGALCVWLLPRAKEPAPPPVITEMKPPPAPTPPRHSDLEAQFAKWSRYAMWADDVTYICMWDQETRTFRDCFEVLRRGDALYFRSIDRPRDLRKLEGVPAESTLEFLNPIPEPRPRFDRLSPPEGLSREK